MGVVQADKGRDEHLVHRPVGRQQDNLPRVALHYRLHRPMPHFVQGFAPGKPDGMESGFPVAVDLGIPDLDLIQGQALPIAGWMSWNTWTAPRR